MHCRERYLFPRAPVCTKMRDLGSLTYVLCEEYAEGLLLGNRNIKSMSRDLLCIIDLTQRNEFKF
jgi:hypothetical protein